MTCKSVAGLSSFELAIANLVNQVARRTKVYYYFKKLQIWSGVILFTGLIEKDAMNNLTYILQAITLRLVIASFLLNSGRGIKAIEVCKERGTN